MISAHKMLMKLTPGYILPICLCKALRSHIPKVQKDSQVTSVYLRFWDLYVAGIFGNQAFPEKPGFSSIALAFMEMPRQLQKW